MNSKQQWLADKLRATGSVGCAEAADEITRLAAVEVAARLLRSAQRAYMAKRGDEALGEKVGDAARSLDAALDPPPLERLRS